MRSQRSAVANLVVAAGYEVDRPFYSEPCADEGCLRNYSRQKNEERERQEMLARRLNGTISLNDWYVITEQSIYTQYSLQDSIFSLVEGVR